MSSAPVPARTLGDELWATLDAIANLQAFRGQVGDVEVNNDGTVKNYAVLYESPGYRSGSRLGSTRDRFAGDFQITCVGRDTATCLWVVDRVTATFTGRLVEVPGLTKKRRITEAASNRAQSVQPDEDVTPVRYFVPLLFSITT